VFDAKLKPERRQLIAATLGLLGQTLMICSASGQATQSKPTPLERSKQLLQEIDRPYNLKTGSLGNLRNLTIRTNNVMLVLRPGVTNRVVKTSHPFFIKNLDIGEADRVLKVVPRDIELSVVGKISASGAILVIEVATLQEIYLAAINANDSTTQTLLIDGVKLPYLNIACGAHDVELKRVEMDFLRFDVNGQATVVAQGKVDELSITSAQKGSAIYVHELAVRNTLGIQALSGNQNYSILVNDSVRASYDNPARSTGIDKKRYPIEVAGQMNRLIVEGGQGADVKVLSAQTLRATQALRTRISNKL
jgi:hypothetical protein